MSAMPYMISDLHLGHKNILKFSNRPASSISEHDDWLIDSINSTVGKRDVLYILGDIAFTHEGLARLGDLRCRNIKGLLGNHDGFPIQEYLVFMDIKPGVIKYKGFWLSHAPIHPDELRGRKNVHGHVHHNSIADDRYINVCVEALNGKPVSLKKLREMNEG